MAKRKNEVLAMPEVVVSYRKDDTPVTAWSVSPSSGKRGDASTDFVNRVMRVPLMSGEVARLVRAHELSHARISPSDNDELEKFIASNGFSDRVVMCAEEVRVNTLVGLQGFDLDHLTDGSEKQSGITAAKEALVSEHARNELFCFGGGLVGTKAFKAYVSGVRSVSKELADELRQMEREIKRLLKGAIPRFLGDTTIKDCNDYRINAGFDNYTKKIANEIQKHVTFIDTDNITESDVIGAGGADYEVGTTAGKFAPLIIDKKFLCDQQVKGHLARKKRATAMGRHLAYPSRLLTDPERRVFSQKSNASGGIVLIDVSGSMDITSDDLDEILRLSPSALVMAYSHKPRSQGIPNAWILANRGKRAKAEALKTIGNIGNGVDGPALDYAIKHRKGNEAIIWVCDGQITDSHDKPPSPEVVKAVAEMVVRNGIIVAPNLYYAIEALRKGRTAVSRPLGRIGRALGRA